MSRGAREILRDECTSFARDIDRRGNSVSSEFILSLHSFIRCVLCEFSWACTEGLLSSFHVCTVFPVATFLQHALYIKGACDYFRAHSFPELLRALLSLVGCFLYVALPFIFVSQVGV